MMMELEKLYYNPSHYADYSAVDNLTRAAKSNFSCRDRSLARIARRVHAAPFLTPKIFTIALQRDKCRRCMRSGFDRTPEYQKLQRQLFLFTGDYRCTQQICLGRAITGQNK